MPGTFEFTMADGFTLNVNVTDEGVIMDLFNNGELIRTAGMMPDEWAHLLWDEWEGDE